MAEAKDVIRRFGNARRERNLYEPTWQKIANVASTLPRTFYPLNKIPGEDWTYKTFDTTAEECLGRFVAIFSSMLTSEWDRWLHFDVFGEKPKYDTRIFFERAEEVFLQCFQTQGFYSLSDSVYDSMGLVGNSMPLVDERPYAGAPGFQGFRFLEIPFEQCYFVPDGNGEVRTCYRYVNWTAGEIISYFGENASIPKKIVDYKEDLRTKFYCIHEVIPKHPDRTMTDYDSTWVIESEQHVVRAETVDGNMYVAARMPRVAAETYGRSPAYKCLGAIQSLNYQAFQRDQAFGFIVNPVHAYQRNNKIPVSQIGPGAWVGMNNVSPEGLRVLSRDINPQVIEAMMNPHVQRVRRAFYTDQIEQIMERPEYGKAEGFKDQSRRNHLVLGPVLTSISRTFLIPTISRCLQLFFTAISAHGVQIPKQILRRGMNVQIVGPLAIAQRAARLEGWRNTMADYAAIVNLQPEAGKVINGERAIRFLAETNWMPTDMTNSPEEVEAMRAQEAQMKAAQMQLDAIAQGGAAYKDFAMGQKAQAQAGMNQ